MVSDREIERQFRVVRQTLAIHAMLRDNYSRCALGVELVLLTASVIFCATTFAGDEMYEFIGLQGSTARIILGIAAVAAFLCSVMLLRVDWKGLAARHDDAVTKWSDTLQIFGESRDDKGSWPQERKKELSEAYWNTHRITVAIPDKRFNRCKSRYLMKRKISALKSNYPGCPRLVLGAIAVWRDTWHVIRGGSRRHEQECQRENQTEAIRKPPNDQHVS